MMTIFVMTLDELNYTDVFMPWDKLEYATGMPIILINMLVSIASMTRN